MAVLYKNNATAVGVTETSLNTDSIQLWEGNGQFFPEITNPLDFFYVRVGTDESNVIYKIINRIDDRLVTDQDPIAEYPEMVPVKLTMCSHLLDHFQQVINTFETYTVGEGEIFETISAFANAFTTPIAEGHTVSLVLRGLLNEVLTDTYLLSSERIQVSGEVVTRSLLSVHSSSGSPGNYSVVLNLNSVAGLIAGHVLVCAQGSVDEGTNSKALYGAHLITAVDTDNNRITVNSRNQSGVPSGSVVGTVIIHTTTISGIELNGKGFQGITSLTVNASDAVESVGLLVDSDFHGVLNGNIAVIQSENGLVLNNVHQGCWIDTIISGCSSGIVARQSNTMFNSMVTGCGQAVVVEEGSLNSFSLNLYGCTEGVHVTLGGSAQLTEPNIEEITNTAVKASRYGYLSILDPILDNNGTNYSPALNTQGNKFGYIDDGT